MPAVSPRTGNQTTPNALRCLSIRQPWVWAILKGPKRFENRDWSTPYRGPVAIHASLKKNHLRALRAGGDHGLPWPSDVDPPGDDQLVYGAIVGLVDLVDVVTPSDAAGDPWAIGPKCLVFERPRLLKTPIPYSGLLRLWTLPADVARRVLAAV